MGRIFPNVVAIQTVKAAEFLLVEKLKRLGKVVGESYWNAWCIETYRRYCISLLVCSLVRWVPSEFGGLNKFITRVSGRDKGREIDSSEKGRMGWVVEGRSALVEGISHIKREKKVAWGN